MIFIDVNPLSPVFTSHSGIYCKKKCGLWGTAHIHLHTETWDYFKPITQEEKYRLALEGIASCSTCSVCRGAAEIALGRK